MWTLLWGCQLSYPHYPADSSRPTRVRTCELLTGGGGFRSGRSRGRRGMWTSVSLLRTPAMALPSVSEVCVDVGAHRVLTARHARYGHPRSSLSGSSRAVRLLVAAIRRYAAPSARSVAGGGDACLCPRPRRRGERWLRTKGSNSIIAKTFRNGVTYESRARAPSGLRVFLRGSVER